MDQRFAPQSRIDPNKPKQKESTNAGNSVMRHE